MKIRPYDKISISGREISFTARPLHTLSSLVDNKSPLGKRLKAHLQYEYYCTWELISSRLYLTKIICKNNDVPINKIFLNFTDKAFAHWFSRDSIAEFGGIFFNEEKEKWEAPYKLNFSFKNGCLQDFSLICNRSEKSYHRWDEALLIILNTEEKILPRGATP